MSERRRAPTDVGRSSDRYPAIEIALPRPVRPATIAVVRVAALLVLAACACARERGNAATGDACRSDFDCARGGYCVAGAGGPTCTLTCSQNDDCPDGWSCSGVTESGVVVCMQGAATPFGY